MLLVAGHRPRAGGSGGLWLGRGGPLWAPRGFCMQEAGAGQELAWDCAGSCPAPCEGPPALGRVFKSSPAQEPWVLRRVASPGEPACPHASLPQGGMSVHVLTARVTEPVLRVSNLDHVRSPLLGSSCVSDTRRWVQGALPRPSGHVLRPPLCRGPLPGWPLPTQGHRLWSRDPGVRPALYASSRLHSGPSLSLSPQGWP